MGLKGLAGKSLDNQSFASPTFTGTVTAAEVVGIERVVASWGVPVILASSGSMADNGAVSGMTALPTTYSNGAWLYLPAGAVAAGEPAAAAFRWFVASSTTAGTVYNSTWDGTGVPPVGTATAYATTGPGAFTGVAAGEVVCATVAIGANDIGLNGRLTVDSSYNFNTAAGNKILRIRYSGGAGTAAGGSTFTTTAFFNGRLNIINQGVANFQRYDQLLNGNGVAGNVAFMAVDTTAATTLVFSLEKNTATNHAIWDGATVRIAYAS